MKMFDVQMGLERLAEARAAKARADADFNSGYDTVMKRLLLGAAINRMSVEQVARMGGLTTKRVRELMRRFGLNPNANKNLLAQHAAEALHENAALLGVEPHEMDLMSPLAYLPMGSEMRKFLETEGVTEDREEKVYRAILAAIDPDRQTPERVAELAAAAALDVLP